MTLVAAWLIGTATLATAASAATPRATPSAQRGAKSKGAGRPTAAPTPPPNEQQKAVIDSLLEIGAYRTLAKYDRATFDALVERVANAPESGSSHAALLAVAQTELIPVTRHYLAHANDKTVITYAQNIVSQIKGVAPRVGLACYAFLAADPAGMVKIAEIDRGTFDADLLDLIADAIETSNTSPLPIPKADEIKPLLNQVMPAMEHRFGADLDILDHLGEPGIDRAKACQTAVSVYSAVLYRLPKWPECAQVLRYLFAKETGQT